jgi:hypothetical protein
VGATGALGATATTADGGALGGGLAAGNVGALIAGAARWPAPSIKGQTSSSIANGNNTNGQSRNNSARDQRLLRRTR